MTTNRSCLKAPTGADLAAAAAQQHQEAPDLGWARLVGRPWLNLGGWPVGVLDSPPAHQKTSKLTLDAWDMVDKESTAGKVKQNVAWWPNADLAKNGQS